MNPLGVLLTFLLFWESYHVCSPAVTHQPLRNYDFVVFYDPSTLFFSSKEDVPFHLDAFDYSRVKQEINHAKNYLIFVVFSATEFCE